MKVSYIWLQEYIQGILPPVEDIVSALTMHSFEIEGVEKNGDDSVLDVKILPNRSHDCLSHYGIASEIASVMNLSRTPLLDPVVLDATNTIAVTVDTPLCTRAVAVHITDIQHTDSPEWLKQKLLSIGQRPINAVVDITNYLMYAFGQPMHAFDSDKIGMNKKGVKEIKIRHAQRGEKITLLNTKEYELLGDMAVIADSHVPLDVAGVMGGRDSGVSGETKDIVLTICNFDAVSVRKTSKTLGVRTDASQRYENEISPSLIDRVLPYALGLITEITGGRVGGGVDVYTKRELEIKVKTSAKKISMILGVDISSQKIIELLGRQLIHAEESGDSIVVSVPRERLDIRLEEDIAEEVGRLYGYENIAPQELALSGGYEVNPLQYVEQSIRRALCRIGFSEIYTYGFAQMGEVLVENPLAGDKKFLRSSLLPAVSASLEHNFKFTDLLGMREVLVYEMGTVFRESGEFVHLALGVKLPKGKKSDVADERIAHAIHTIEDELGVSVGDVSIVGGVAEINIERIISEVKVPEKYPDDFWVTPLHAQGNYMPISPYPFAVRDVAVFVSSTVSAESVEGIIRTHLTPIVVRLSLFDTFTKNFPDGTSKTSYAFRLVFQSLEKTLTDDEINAVMNPIYDSLKAQEGFEIR